ncbi:MAG TPA: hypothetical protein DC017_16110 [Candidatus Wallbacteria bacterium]|nr:hypothetical protein [Candidatus Wallbacteria bacterium]
MKRLPFLLPVLFISAALSLTGTPLANAGEYNFKTFNEKVSNSNYEIQLLKNDLKSFEKASEAEAKTLPIVLEAEGEGLIGNTEEKRYDVKNIELSKTFEAGRIPRLKKRKNRLEMEIKKQEITQAIENLIYDADIAVLKCVRAIDLKKLSNENLDMAAKTIDAAAKKYEVALASRMELEQAGIDYEIQFLKNMEVQKDLEIEKRSVEIINGMTRDAFIDNFFSSGREGSLTSEMELLSANTAIELYNADKLFRLAIENRRIVKSALNEIELYKNLIELEKQSGGPEFKLGVYRSVNDVKETERGVRLGLSIPIHDFGKRSAAVESLNLKLSGYEFLKEHKSYYLAGVENKILLEVNEKYDTCVFYREKLKRLSGVVLKKSSNIFEMARIGYAEGATTLFEYQNAKKNYFEFYESLIQASIDFNISLLELRRACGIAPSDNGDIMEKILSKIGAAGDVR